MSEIYRSPEIDRKNEWLEHLAGFIVEAGQNGWAADAPRVEVPQRPGFKELSYERDEWKYRDSYAGYYLGPGSSVIYYKEQPVWYMSYGGAGQSEEHFDKAKETYAFLRTALLHPKPEFPVRGPSILRDSEEVWVYGFSSHGTLAEGSWEETIDKDDVNIFNQDGIVGLIIDKNENRQPIYPWNL